LGADLYRRQAYRESGRRDGETEGISGAVSEDGANRISGSGKCARRAQKQQRPGGVVASVGKRIDESLRHRQKEVRRRRGRLSKSGGDSTGSLPGAGQSGLDHPGPIPILCSAPQSAGSIGIWFLLKFHRGYPHPKSLELLSVLVTYESHT